MSVCTHDNPATMARECWQDGKLLCSYSWLLLIEAIKGQHIPYDKFFFGANIGPWKAGQIVGDPSAIGHDA